MKNSFSTYYFCPPLGVLCWSTKEEMIETDMDDFQLENFKNEWEEKWKPSIREDEPGILTRFFKIFNPFA